MPKTPDIPDSMMWELDAAFNAVEDQIALNQHVYNATEKALGEIARRFYPHIATWEPDQLRRLADRISRAASAYCLDLNNLDDASDQAKEQERA
jgi:hypothetical protein